jgi:hypothetical protein
MVRLSYRHELRSALTFPLAASLAEGSFTGVVAAKNFQAGVVLMSVITAAPCSAISRRCCGLIFLEADAKFRSSTSSNSA